MKDNEYVIRAMTVIDKFYPKLVALRSSRNEQEYYRQGLIMIFELEQAVRVKNGTMNDAENTTQRRE